MHRICRNILPTASRIGHNSFLGTNTLSHKPATVFAVKQCISLSGPTTGYKKQAKSLHHSDVKVLQSNPFLDQINTSTLHKIPQDTLLKFELTKLPGVYASLSKWYLTLFVVMTADAGYCLAPVQFHHFTFFLATIGTGLCSCCANSLNQIAEVPYDAQMDRTRNRPLVRGVITPLHALGFSVFSGVSGVACLYYGTNLLTALLGLSNIFLYAAVYTPLKRRHWFNTWAGAVVGAIPPLMGWTAATGRIDTGAFIFAGILYAWQFPHFYALAWRRRGDYARGSYHMLPLSHPGATRYVVLSHSLALWGLCVASPFTGVTSLLFIPMSAPMNAWLTYSSLKFFRQKNSKSAQTLYRTSLYYILLLSIAICVDRKLLQIDEVKIPPNDCQLAMSNM
uniref:Protoheme IX farnesyltransferase, mitochondrial n=1 Tax=Phallusia mammillata TaxID=59560 RepID=A0A6F9D9A9_9ASCI|nr:protoheme IX farnesyltransferase, mitochondrial [Phallusia mammillata]